MTYGKTASSKKNEQSPLKLAKLLTLEQQRSVRQKAYTHKEEQEMQAHINDLKKRYKK